MTNRFSLIAALALSASVAFAATDAPANKHHHHGPATRPSAAAAVQPYPLKTCVVSGEELGGDMGDPVVIDYKGREIKFCCSSCIKKFKKDPDKYLKKIDAEAAKQQKAAEKNAEKKPDQKPAAK